MGANVKLAGERKKYELKKGTRPPVESSRKLIHAPNNMWLGFTRSLRVSDMYTIRLFIGRIVKFNKNNPGPYDPRKTSLKKCEFVLFFQSFSHFSCRLPARVGEKFMCWSLNLSRNIEPKRLLFRTSVLEVITATQANIGQEGRQKSARCFFLLKHSAQHSVQLFGAHVLPSCLLQRSSKHCILSNSSLFFS